MDFASWLTLSSRSLLKKLGFAICHAGIMSVDLGLRMLEYLVACYPFPTIRDCFL